MVAYSTLPRTPVFLSNLLVSIVTLLYVETNSREGSIIIKFTCFYCDSATVRKHYSSPDGSVIIKLAYFYCDIAFQGRQYSSIGGSVVIKFTCLYCDIAVRAKQYSSIGSCVINNKFNCFYCHNDIAAANKPCLF